MTYASSSTESPTLYFGYGSNLWLNQMRQRCPNSPYRGVARLPGYRWHINDRGYANVEQTGSISDEVYGLVYELAVRDERRLDRNEGVPYAYTKEIHKIQFWPHDSALDGRAADDSAGSEEKKMLVYIDRKRTVNHAPQREYVFRMNMAIMDALMMGVPWDYVNRVMRPFIPDKADEDTRELALEQASEFKDAR